MTDQIISIGKIVATIGFKGEMVLQHKLGGKSDLKNLRALIVEIQKKSMVPYFISAAKAKSDTETLIFLEEVNTREEAKKLLQKTVWLTHADFGKYVKPNATIGLIGYAVVEENKVIGVIHEIIEQPHQVICTVMVHDKEVLIPLNESTLIKIDRNAKKIFVTLPEGLLDIYLH